jgi:hypothetical protein
MGVLPQSRPAGLPGLAHRGRLDIRLNYANHIHAPCRCGIGPDSLLCAAHFRGLGRSVERGRLLCSPASGCWKLVASC